jgi:hypothetical protein
MDRRVVRFGGLLAAGMLGFWLLLTLLTQDPEGGNRTWAWDSMQMVAPVSLMLTAATATALYMLATQKSHQLTSVALVLVAVGGAASGAQSFMDLTSPLSGHEVVDAAEIRVLLEGVDPLAALILVSDLSDPAQDHLRNGSAFYLSNPYGHRFWLTQTRYGHESLRETEDRIDDIARFFGAAWSPWHESFLSQQGLTHVAISTRCPSAWDPGAIQSLVYGAATDSWAVFRFDARTAQSAPKDLGHDSNSDGLRPRMNSKAPVSDPSFGRAPCL